MDCELCGRQDTLVDAVVEGSMMKVCRYCASYGNIIVLEKPIERVKHKPKLEIPEEYIADNYGSQIKSARERLKLTQQELAIKIAEKESIIHKLESYYLEPSIDLARKLEKMLNIKLICMQEQQVQQKKINFKDDSVTIGDIIKMKK